MELRKIASKKPLKLLTLLLTSMLIASASAAVYYSLSMTSTVTTAAPNVIFVKGADNGTAGVTITDGSVATLANLSAYPGIVLTYTDPLRLKNNGSAPCSIKLVPKSFSGPSSNFTYINFTLVDGTNNYTLAYIGGSSWTPPTETTLQTMDAGAEWPIKVETKAISGAVAGQVVTIVIEVYVEE
jgi:hypothetical protein